MVWWVRQCNIPHPAVGYPRKILSPVMRCNPGSCYTGPKASAPRGVAYGTTRRATAMMSGNASR
jgi:hypothetical protein